MLRRALVARTRPVTGSVSSQSSKVPAGIEIARSTEWPGPRKTSVKSRFISLPFPTIGTLLKLRPNASAQHKDGPNFSSGPSLWFNA